MNYEIKLPDDARLSRVTGWDCGEDGCARPGTERAADLRGRVGVVFSSEPESAIIRRGTVDVYVEGRIYVVPYELVRVEASAPAGGKNNALLIEAGRALLGEQWQVPLSRELGVNPRTVRHWVAGEFNVPAGVYGELLRLCEERVVVLRELVKRLGKA